MRPKTDGSGVLGPGADQPESARLEIERLLAAWHDGGDRQAREELIERFLPLVWKLARRYALDPDQFEDLAQVGTIGLIKAIDRYEPERGCGLPAFAVPTILGELRRYLRDTAWAVRVPRRIQELSVSLDRQLRESAGNEYSFTAREFAAWAGVSTEEAEEALVARHARYPVSLSNLVALDVDGTEALQHDGAADLAVNRAVLTRALSRLSERQRRILHLRFYGELTQSQIAEAVGISQIHVSRLLRQALDEMQRDLVKDGVTAAA